MKYNENVNTVFVLKLPGSFFETNSFSFCICKSCKEKLCFPSLFHKFKNRCRRIG
ncbi:hypothetical protein EHQ74_05815 [Leptospira levettii]|nr:hypothetical protein EHQ74_05815 [Leptospira levettii]TGM84978.1 hypothetical protein EHR00_11065 [Leptospira levettii]